jgi:hypothetical protein
VGYILTPRTFASGATLTAAQLNENRDAWLGVTAAWTTDARSSAVVWTGTGTNPVLGNGFLISKYMQIGKTIDWEVRITMGSTTTFGSAGWLLNPPVAYGTTYLANFYARAYDASLSTSLGWQLNADLVSAAVQITCAPTTQPNADRLVTSAIPFAWATSDVLSLNVRYETT